ncbi:hypothetical protein AB0L05_12155 [Nonomuraea pusilla]|uniref:hypothetical protein n=1 Tax=Nonomuraea pusilla TaxID=46177 RepID=UPI0033240128
MGVALGGGHAGVAKEPARPSVRVAPAPVQDGRGALGGLPLRPAAPRAVAAAWKGEWRPITEGGGVAVFRVRGYPVVT